MYAFFKTKNFFSLIFQCGTENAQEPFD